MNPSCTRSPYLTHSAGLGRVGRGVVIAERLAASTASVARAAFTCDWIPRLANKSLLSSRPHEQPSQ